MPSLPPHIAQNPLAEDGVTARERAEANSVTATRAGHQFEIQLGHLCNNRCVFCSSGQLTQLKIARHIPLAPIVAAIEEARAAGARRVTFLGGEPTLHKGFLDALRRAVELGFPEIVLFTNGVLLPHPGFIDAVCALGSFEWRISIQGGDEAAHVAVTGRADSFRRIVTGLEMLRARGQRVTANLCVNEHSYRSLPGYADLARDYALQQLHVDIIRPSSIGQYTDDYLRSIQPRYSEMAPYLRRMLARFDEELPGFDVNIGNLPFCILPEAADRIHHGGEDTFTKSCDAEGLEVGVDKYDWHKSLRRHPEACGSCLLRSECTGVFAEYLRIHGDAEFQPITHAQLAQLDRETGAHRLFSRAVAPLLAHLRGASPPAPWTLAEWGERKHGEAGIEARFRSARGATLTFTFTPPAAARGEILDEESAVITSAYHGRLLLDAPPGTLPTAAELRALLVHVADALAAPLPPGTVVPTVARPLDVEATLRAALRPGMLSLGRARLLQLVAALTRRGRLGGFRVASVRGRPEGRGAIVDLRGPNAAQVELHASYGAAEDPSRVVLDGVPVSGATLDEARALVLEARAGAA